MKTKLLIALTLIAASVGSTANAAEQRWPNWYVGLNGGANWNGDDDFTTGGASAEIDQDEGYMLGVSLGYTPSSKVAFFNNTRWELEYTYRTNDIETIGGAATSGETRVNSFMGNIFYDFRNESRWTPYVGGGLGLANVEIETNGIDDDDNVFAWQLMAGLDYSPASFPNTVWGIGYRYFATADADYDTAGAGTEREYDAHGLEAKARFRF